MSARNHSITFFVNRDEMIKIESASQENDETKAEFCRNAALSYADYVLDENNK